MNNNDDIKNWLHELEFFKLPKWEGLPEFPLYMDQVVTFLESQLTTFNVGNQEKQITTWMINNYVKGDLISNPVQKKYSKEHMTKLFIIWSLKQALSIPEIGTLLKELDKLDEEKRILYNDFVNIHQNVLNDISKEIITVIDDVKNIDGDNDELLTNIAIKLAIDSQIRKIISSRLIEEISSRNHSTNNSFEILQEKIKETEKLARVSADYLENERREIEIKTKKEIEKVTSELKAQKKKTK